MPISGFAQYYFGVGRLIYFGAPLLIGWAIASAAWQRLKAAWPAVGLILVACIGATAQVHTTHPVARGIGHVNMHFVLGQSVQTVSAGLVHASIILLLSALPYVLWRSTRLTSFSRK